MKNVPHSTKLEYLRLPIKSKNALIKKGILTIQDFLAMSEKDMLKIRNIGPKSAQYLLDIQKKYIAGRYIPHKHGSFPSKRQARKLNKVFDLYSDLGTLEAVAKELNITRERVRQLLNRGQEYNLFKYVTTRELRMTQLIKRVKKDQLVSEINKSPKIFDICSALDINISDYHKLVKYYKINAQEYFYDSRKRKYLTKYSRIVDYLGHHPSTTEMQRRREWRYIYTAIARIWGSTEHFRSEFGIEKPPFRFHPNTLKAWQRSLENRVRRKKAKKIKVLDLIKLHKMNDVKTISKALNLSEPSVGIYLSELVDEKQLTKVKIGTKNKYMLNN